MHLEDLHIVIRDRDTACRLEGRISLHLRIEQHRAETAVALIVRLEVDLHLAHALEIVAHRSLGALDFIAQIVLAAGGNARAGDRANRAVGIFRHKGHDVLVLHIGHLGGTRCLRALGEYNRAHGVNLADIAHDELGNGQQVRAEVAQRAAARQLVDVAPGDRQAFVEQLILIIGAGEPHNLAQCAGLNQLTHIGVGRVHGVVEADIVDNAFLRRKLGQFFGFLR